MSIFSKLMDTMRLTEDEEYYDEDEEFEEEEPKSKKHLFGRSRDAEEEEEPEDNGRSSHFLSSRQTSGSKVVPMKRSMEVSLVKPSSMEDSREICDLLLSGRAVVLNMEGMRMEMAQRIIDFTCGATYSMNGNLQKISNYIFIATPASVSLSGEFPELMADGSLNIYGMNLHL